MNPDLVKAALDAIESGDVEACKQILKDCIASACGGEAGEMPAMPESAPTDALSDNAETPAPAPEEDPTALTALSVALKELTGSESPGEIGSCTISTSAHSSRAKSAAKSAHGSESVRQNAAIGLP